MWEANFRFGPDSGDSDFTEQDASDNDHRSEQPATVGDSIFFHVYW